MCFSRNLLRRGYGGQEERKVRKGVGMGRWVSARPLAEETERELGGAEDAQGGGESAASAVAMEDIPRINFGLGGFMQV